MKQTQISRERNQKETYKNEILDRQLQDRIAALATCQSGLLSARNSRSALFIPHAAPAWLAPSALCCGRSQCRPAFQALVPLAAHPPILLKACLSVCWLPAFCKACRAQRSAMYCCALCAHSPSDCAEVAKKRLWFDVRNSDLHLQNICCRNCSVFPSLASKLNAEIFFLFKGARPLLQVN